MVTAQTMDTSPPPSTPATPEHSEKYARTWPPRQSDDTERCQPTTTVTRYPRQQQHQRILFYKCVSAQPWLTTQRQLSQQTKCQTGRSAVCVAQHACNPYCLPSRGIQNKPDYKYAAFAMSAASINTQWKLVYLSTCQLCVEECRILFLWLVGISALPHDDLVLPRQC